MSPRFRLKAPVVKEHPLQKAIADVMRLEIAPPGRVSRNGVVWWSVDHAFYGGDAPGARVGRGIIAGILDMQVIYLGRAHLIELKTEEGVVSEAQQLLATSVLASGGRVGIVQNVAETLQLLDAWHIPRARRVGLAA